MSPQPWSLRLEEAPDAAICSAILEPLGAYNDAAAGPALDTWTFQAPGFHEKLGFAECGRIPNYPPGYDRIFYARRLD